MPQHHVLLRPPLPADLAHIAAHMRAADVAECAAGGAGAPLRALRDSVERSTWALVATYDGEPALVVGVAPIGGLLSDTGSPWMLGTDLVTRHYRAFIPHGPRYIARMQAAFSHLLNFVHAENAASIRWLKRMGFTVFDAAPYGPHGALFHRFEMHADGSDHLLDRQGPRTRGPDRG